MLLPVNVGKRATVVVIVPDALHYVISAKQVPMPAGLHELGHADQLQWGQLTAWLAENQQAELSEYDPAVHGPDQRCGRTKARLRSGDRIVLCPGCGMIFSERAYALGRPCEYCRHDPAQAEWVPPPPRSNGQGLAELFGLLGVDRGHRQYQAEA